MSDDQTLLREFAVRHDEAAFTELVGRHLGMVQGVCQRRTGDSQLAEELAQNVFTSLARKAGKIRPDVLVTGWLYRAACFECVRALRSEDSRKRNMKRYEEMNSQNTSSIPEWSTDIAPHLDEAINHLAPADRDVILMRFVSGYNLRQIGKVHGKSESAAQRHLQRALEKLSAGLKKRGATVGVGLLATHLGSELAAAAPTSFTIATIAKTSIANASMATGSTLTITTAIIIMKQKTAIVAAICLLAAAGSAVYVKTRPASEADPKAGADSALSRSSDSQIGEDADRGNASFMGDKVLRRDRSGSELSDLADRYGESRVKLAKNATTNLISVAESMAGILEFAKSQQGVQISGNEPKEALQRFVKGIDLSDEQKAKLDGLVDEYDARDLEEIRGLKTSLSENREQVMELMLSSDAAFRGDISAEELKAFAADKESILGPFSSNDTSEKPSAPIDKLLGDEPFMTGLRETLDQGQITKFDEAVATRKSRIAARAAKAADAGQADTKKVEPQPSGLNLDIKFSLSEPQSLEELDNQLFRTKSALDGAMKLLDAVSAP